MGPHRRAQERERAAARAAAEAKRADAERKAIAEAQKTVASGMLHSPGSAWQVGWDRGADDHRPVEP
jgi:hypothetical protein